LDKTLFVLLRISLKWSLNRYGVYVVISSVSYYQPHTSDRLTEKRWIRWDIIGLPNLQKQNSWQSHWLCFATTTLYCIFNMFVQLPIHCNCKTALLLLHMQNYCGC